MKQRRVIFIECLKCLALISSLCLSLLWHSSAFSYDGDQLEKLIDFNKINLNAFEEVRFKGVTRYQLVQLDSSTVLKAESQASASGLLLKQTVDLSKTPYLNWRWRLEKALPALPETQKAGDDYAARIYLIHSGGWFFWQTKALNYVWSSRKARETTWPNAYAPDNAMMKAVRDTTDDTGRWFTEKRHVVNDFKAWLGKDISDIEAIAIMTDTDDSGHHAIVFYGDVYFSAD